ncbi:MAG: hypothetical protein LBO79_04725 [Zoogloeaceae bacterium]|jgi:hypothetical protein|nr:hypothetical protein [Zoogloeaceae bacterium]
MKFQKILSAVTEKCRGLSNLERTQLSLAACFVIALFYGLLGWMPTHKKIGEEQYKAAKQAARLKSSGKPEQTLSRIPAGFDITRAKQELETIQASLEKLERERARFERRFLPLDDLESLQLLKSELTRLAESGDMEVLALEHIYARAEDRERPPTLELLKEASQNAYQRPLLSLKARASYRGLMQFLDGLDTLTYAAAPVWSNIAVKTGKTAGSSDSLNNSAQVKQWLEVEIRLAV